MHCGTRHGPSGTAGAHAASSCSARFLSASACSRAVTVKNVLKRSSTCVSTQSTNGRRRPRASAAREQSTPSTPTPLTCSCARPPAPPGSRVLRVPRPPLRASASARQRRPGAEYRHEYGRVGLLSAYSVGAAHLGLLDELREILDRLACSRRKAVLYGVLYGYSGVLLESPCLQCSRRRRYSGGTLVVL